MLQPLVGAPHHFDAGRIGQSGQLFERVLD
jgi:hypothetical protein